MSTEKKDTCVHPPCGCAIPVGQFYCSDACRDARSEDACGCSHAHCAASARKSDAA